MGAGLHGGFGCLHEFQVAINPVDDNFLQEKLNYLYNGEKNFIPKHSIFNNKPKVIAGKGSKTVLRKENVLIMQYGGKVGDWSKKVVRIKSAKYIFDIHYYQKGSKQYMAKVKSRKEIK